jgi:hypothetical protein
VPKGPEKKRHPDKRGTIRVLPMELTSATAWPTRLASGKSSADRVCHRAPRVRHRAPYEGPTRRLEFSRDVAMAPVDVASFELRRPQALASFAQATVENHIPALVREFMLEIQVSFWLGARHDEDQVCHDRLRLLPASGSTSRNRTSGTADPKPRGRVVVRSEDAATGETEGGHAELWAICRLARTVLRDLGTHIDCRIQAPVIPNKKGIPRIAPGELL